MLTQHIHYFRFLWFQGNNPLKPIVEYRMNVDLFGNGPSPVVTTYSPCRMGLDGEEEYGEEAKRFIHRNLQVDDSLASLTSA